MVKSCETLPRCTVGGLLDRECRESEANPTSRIRASASQSSICKKRSTDRYASRLDSLLNSRHSRPTNPGLSARRGARQWFQGVSVVSGAILTPNGCDPQIPGRTQIWNEVRAQDPGRWGSLTRPLGRVGLRGG